MKTNTTTAGNKEMWQRILIIVLLAALIVTLLLLLVQCEGEEEEYTGPSRTAVIQQNQEEPLNETGSGTIRIVINPVVQVLDDTMQNLGFCNYNKDRLLQCRIKAGEHYVYDSGLLPEGTELAGDFVDTEYLQTGENAALAEIYSYDLDENLIGQTNVKIKLDLQQ